MSQHGENYASYDAPTLNGIPLRQSQHEWHSPNAESMPIKNSIFGQ
jgi:hypothetical protein